MSVMLSVMVLFSVCIQKGAQRSVNQPGSARWIDDRSRWAYILKEGPRHCYHCSSHAEGACGVSVSANLSLISKKICENMEMFCGKVQITLTGGYKSITRDCYSTDKCDDVTVWGGSSKKCSFCDTDFCNASTVMVPTFLSSIFSLGLVTFYTNLFRKT